MDAGLPPQEEDCPCGRFATGSCAADQGLRCYVSRTPTGGLHPLHKAVGAGDAATVTRLLNELPAEEPLPRDTCTNTPLHRAAALADASIVWTLLAHCGPQRAVAELAAVNAAGWTPAHTCCANPGQLGAAETLRTLADWGADLHVRTAPPDPDPQFECWADDTCLGLAVQHAASPAALPLLHELLQQGLDPLEPAGWLSTSPLEFACAAGDVEVVQLLLCATPFSPMYNKYGIDCAYLLALAVAHGCADVAELLLAPPTLFHRVLTRQLPPPEPRSVLEAQPGNGSGDGSREASDDGGGSGGTGRGSGDGEGLAVHGQAGRRYEAYNHDQPAVQPHVLEWCLHLAIRGGSLEVVRMLVQVGGASGSHSRCSWEVLSELQGHLEGLGWQGRFPRLHRIMSQPDFSEPPLILALRKQQLHIATWLIKRTGAAFPRMDASGRTAVHWTVRLGATQLLTWLLETGQYRLRSESGVRAIDVQDSKHYSALAYAIMHGHVAEVDLLLRYGADMHDTVATPHGRLSVVEAAMVHKSIQPRRRMLMLLLQRGAQVDSDDLQAVVELGQAWELRVLLRSLRDSGQQLRHHDAARLLLLAAKKDRVECLEGALLEGLSGSVELTTQGGGEVSLLEACFHRNSTMWLDSFGYDEAAGRMGWQRLPSGEVTRVCWSRTRLRALRIMQALRLAGADPAPVVGNIKEMADPQGLRDVADGLQSPRWLQEQHGLWPAAFQAAVVALLQGLHRMAARLAPPAGAWGAAGGMVEVEAEGQGQAVAAPLPAAAFPGSVACRIVAQMAAQWPWPGAAAST